jgi:CRISPR/Cas system-associated endonuclease Cas1
LNNRITKIKTAIEEIMDNREKSFQVVLEFKKQNGFIPAQYESDHKFMSNYENYKRTGSWRKNPIAVKLIEKTIKKMAKNSKKSGVWKDKTAEEIQELINKAQKNERRWYEF